MLPTPIVSIAIGISIAVQLTDTEAKATINTLPRTAKPAALGPTDINAVIEVGAPSYASGAHIWTGTAAILNPNAITKNMTESNSAGFPIRPFSLIKSDIAFISVVPVI